jgi:single-strand DNA-binding protein
VNKRLTSEIMSVNKAFILGRVGKDPLVSHYNNAKKVTFSMATTGRGYTKQDGTQVPDRTEWHNIVAWRNLAEVCEKYVHKGDILYIEGKITTRSWDDERGQKHYITEIVAEVVELFPRNQQNGAQEAPGGQQSPANEWQPKMQPLDDDQAF